MNRVADIFLKNVRTFRIYTGSTLYLLQMWKSVLKLYKYKIQNIRAKTRIQDGSIKLLRKMGNIFVRLRLARVLFHHYRLFYSPDNWLTRTTRTKWIALITIILHFEFQTRRDRIIIVIIVGNNRRKRVSEKRTKRVSWSVVVTVIGLLLLLHD